jgi:hypothetical protein
MIRKPEGAGQAGGWNARVGTFRALSGQVGRRVGAGRVSHRRTGLSMERVVRSADPGRDGRSWAWPG